MKHLLFVIGVASATGCLDTAAVTGAEQAIENGDYMSRLDQEHLGAVVVNNGEGTGVMLDNKIGITAGHVVDRKVATAGYAWNPEIKASQTYTFSAVDFSLFKLDEPLEMNGSKEGFSNIIGEAAVDDTVLVAGQGYTNAEGAYDGLMHEGRMRVTVVGDPLTPRYTTMLPDPSQIHPGDSGGPSFARGMIIGVHGMAEDATDCPTCRAWDITVFPLFWGIVAASEPWTGNATNLLNIMGVELRVNYEIDYDENTGPWYQLARIANEMCTNRNDQNAGHYTGSFGGDRFGLVCSGRNFKHATVFQSLSSVRYILGLTQPFEAIGWAEANRFAQQDCMARDNFSAGYYTGDRDAADSWTLNCYRGKLYNPTRVELVDAGFPGKDLADTGYAEAMRAADKYCSGRMDFTFTPVRKYKTGFMTGRTEGNNKTYEVLCEY